MPVDNKGTFFPVPDVQFEAVPEELTVAADHNQTSTGLDERTPGDASETADWHDQKPSGAFEQPGPETVVMPGFEAAFGGDVQKKVVKAPKKNTGGKTTGGAEGK